MQLNMPLKSRIAVSTALSLSVLACIVSIYKLAIFGQVFEILATDPTYLVPYLDILGVSEGAILLICSSLPTLGALFRLARGKLTSTDGSRNVPNQSAASNQGRSGGMGNSSRANYQGHKLEDPENGSTRTAGVHSSVDDVPLVSTSKTMY